MLFPQQQLSGELLKIFRWGVEAEKQSNTTIKPLVVVSWGTKLSSSPTFPLVFTNF
jgi:hypothetical protein